jgi:transposase, IS30 family
VDTDYFQYAERAQFRAGTRPAGKRKLEKSERLRSYVKEKLSQEWSPREIIKRLKIEYASDMEMRISHEEIYQYL